MAGELPKVGILGFGKMGRNHARVLSSLDAVETVGFFDPYLKDGEFFGITPHASIHSLLDQVDYVVISAPTNLHAGLAISAAEKNVHCLIEKPLASKVSEAEEILRAFQDSESKSALGMIERFNPALRVLKQKIDLGLLGQIFQISTRREGPFPERITDVGVGLDLGSHDLDLVQWLLGSKVSQLQIRTRRWQGRDFEDYFVTSGETVSGCLVSNTVNWRNPKKVRRVSVYGEFGVLEADALGMTLTLNQMGEALSDWEAIQWLKGPREGDSISFGIPKIEPLVAEHLAFLKLIETGDLGDLSTLSEGLDVLRLLEMRE
jgi:predicted dehydrogenase